MEPLVPPRLTFEEYAIGPVYPNLKNVSYFIQIVIVFLVWRLLVTMRRMSKRVQPAEPKSVRQYIVIKSNADNPAGAAPAVTTTTPVTTAT